MTPVSASRTLMIIRSFIIVCGMVIAVSISTRAETVKLMDFGIN